MPNNHEVLAQQELPSDPLTQHLVATMLDNESDITPYLTDAAIVRVWSAMRTFFNQTTPQYQFILEIKIPEAEADESTESDALESDEYQSVVDDETSENSETITLRNYRGGSIVIHYDRRDDPDSPSGHWLSKTTPVALISREIPSLSFTHPFDDGFRFTIEWNSLNTKKIQAIIEELKAQGSLTN